MNRITRLDRQTRKAMSKLSLALVIFLAAAALLAFTPAKAHATFLLWNEGVNHPEIDWKYTETEHFIIYWYPEEKFTARALLKVAEDIYEHDSRVWNFELKRKINVVILDTEDNANGFAAYNFNWVTIWASHLYDFDRGRTDWIADVFSHELGHIVSLNAGAWSRENLLGIIVGGAKASRKYNFDMGLGVFYGSDNLPTWLVEGASQFSSLTMGADLYDTHREMLVRGAVIDDNLLTMDEMDIIYDKNSLQAEMVYNQGMSMNSWMAETWGLDAPGRIWHETGSGIYPTYHRTLTNELGVDREQLYNQWKAYVTAKYNKQIKEAMAVSGGQEVRGDWLQLFETDPQTPEAEMSKNDRWFIGITNAYPRYSPDGKYISLLSSHGAMQRRGATLYLKKTKPDPNVLNDTKIKKAFKLGWSPQGYAWSHDGKKIVYSKTDTDPWYGYEYADLYVYDIEKDKSDQITWKLRAMEPDWSPDGTKIAFIVNYDGQRKLAVMRYPKINGYYLLIDYNDETQIGHPAWSPDGTKLAFLMWRKKQQNIWVINADGSNLRPVTYDSHENRDPAWLNNDTLVFSTDRTGIFNLFSVGINTHKMTQITNVKTGAFQPWPNADSSSITYSYFTSYGYRAYEIKKDKWLNKPVEDFEFNVTDDEVRANLTSVEPLPEIQGLDYRVYDGFAGLFPIMYEHAGTWVWIPIVNYDDSRLQVGAQFLMVDAVERNMVQGYVAIGEESRYSVWYENYMTPVTIYFSMHRLFPTYSSDFQFFNFNIKAQFDANFYFFGVRYMLFNENNMSLEYFYQDIRVEQPSMRSRQITGRALSLAWERDTVNRYAVDGDVNPRDGTYFRWQLTYANPRMHEPFTGVPMGSDLADFYSDPAVITEAEARQYPDNNYLLPDYGYWQTMLTWRKYMPFPFWDLTPLNDSIGGFDWSKLNFERWRRQNNSLILKFMGGFTHSTVPEGYGWGNSYGRVNFYDRFHGGGMYVSALGAFSDNGAFLGYDDYSLEGETMAIAGFDYRFPILREINVALWAFYFDKFYMSFFGDAGNLWSHVEHRRDMWNLNKVFDKNYDGHFNARDDLLTDLGVEFRMSMYLFNNSWDSFVKIAHGFQDPDNKKPPLGVPLRFYIGLGTGFDDR